MRRGSSRAPGPSMPAALFKTLAAACVLQLVQLQDAADHRRPAVGAIRWDAWYGGVDPVGAYVEEALTPPQWRYRLPFFAQEPSGSPGVSKKKIVSARACGCFLFRHVNFSSV